MEVPVCYSGLTIAHSDEDSPASRRTKPARLRQRKEDREVSNERRKELADRLKQEGNEHFRQGHYVEAIAKYNEAARAYGLRPVIMCNLAAAYLKLEQFELAEWATDCALFHSPHNAKARFRRAMARKELAMFKGAELDLKVVIQHHPEITEARDELVQVQQERKEHGDGQRPDDYYDEDFPPFDGEEWDPPLDSDSEDVGHVGNGRPCRFYNHDGCGKGALCDFSHAPDSKSIRDELGQNVCVCFLLGTCRYGAGCIYAHTKDYLPQGWWSTPQGVQEAKKLCTALDDPLTPEDIIVTLENTTAYGRFKKSRDYQSSLKLHSLIQPDVLKSRIKDKTAVPERLLEGTGPFILLLCLENAGAFDEIHQHLLNALTLKVKIIRIKNVSQASTYLGAPQLVGVIAGDAGIVRSPNYKVASQLAEYVKRGGSVVFGGLFPSSISGTEFDHFFSKNFGLQWEYGSYFRTTFNKNPGSNIVKDNPSLEASYSMKALHAKGATPKSAIYTATESSYTQSLVFPSAPVTDFSESPAVSARVEKGVVNFLGDVNAEEESTKTVLAMLGLLDTPRPAALAVPKIEKSPEAPQPTTGKKANGKKKKKGKKKKTSGANTPPSVSLPEVTPNTAPRKVQTSISPHFQQFIMQLALNDDASLDWSYRSSVAAIKAKVDVIKATTEVQALTLLSSPYLDGVFVTDCELTNAKYNDLLKKLVAYVNNGGPLVFGGTFAGSVERPKANALFAEFQLDWKVSDSTRAPLVLNPDGTYFTEKNPFLPKEIRIKALFLTGVVPDDMVYCQTYDTYSQTPIAFTDASEGKSIGYIGDINADACTTPVILAMFDLLRYPRSVPKPAPSKFVIVLTHFDAIDEYEQTPLFQQLKDKRVEIVTDERLSDPRLADLLSSPDLHGILVLDDVLPIPEREWLGHQIAEYIWSGGTVIFGGEFGVMTPPDDFEQLMTVNFCLAWKISCATELSVKLNRENALIQRLPSAVQQENVYSEGSFVYDVSPEAIVYGSQPGLGPERATHVPVAYAAVGKGHVAYFGHSEIGELDARLMVSMLKL